VKTHKCLEAARLQVRGHFGGICVSTLAEARFFAADGFDDITYAVPIAPARIGEAVALADEVKLGLLVDHLDAAEALAAEAARAHRTIDVWLKIDCGYHRAGVLPGSPEALALVAALGTASHLRFAGLLTHGGHSYACKNVDEIRAVAKQERDAVVGFAAELTAEGVEVPGVSLGSTPTLSVADDLSGVTEVRPGNYVFYDAFQAAIGSCAIEDAAFSVLVSVIGVHGGEAARVVIDGGALALSKDAGAHHVDPDVGYGLVADVNGELLDGLRLTSLSQEHGLLHGDASALAALRVGDRLRIVANHSCLAAALHERFEVIRGRAVVDVWRPIRGW
jgi:D-serine deaminase-like pyridoxal phosphate-dependent protein